MKLNNKLMEEVMFVLFNTQKVINHKTRQFGLCCNALPEFNDVAILGIESNLEFRTVFSAYIDLVER